MSRSLNKVTLIGNVGQDPEVRSTQNGKRVATFSLATSRTWKGANNDTQEKTEWHRCVAWNAGTNSQGLADIIERYVKKGDRLFVEGRIEYRQWQDKDSVTRYTTEVHVREILLLGSPRENGDTNGPTRGRPTANDKRHADPRAGEFEDFPGALADEADDLPF